MKKLELIKAGIGLVVSVGVGAIVGNVVKATTPADVKTLTKLCIAAGSLVLTGVAGDMASKYTEEQIDSVVDGVKEVININTEEQEEFEEEA